MKRKTTLVGLSLVGVFSFSVVAMGFGAVNSAANQVGAPAAATSMCAAIPETGSVQARNASIIASVGAQMGVSKVGQIIAIAVSLVEAGGKNLASSAVPESINYPNDGVAVGDHDSVGLFQQRASWGSVAERMDPATSARLFYRALLGMSGWDALPPGDAAADVQRPAEQYRGRYALKMVEATGLVDAGAPVPCVEPVASGGGGNGFTDGPPITYSSSRSPAEAIAWARAQAGTNGWYRRCLAFVTQATGSWLGVPYAIDAFHVTPADRRHDANSPEGRSPSPGAALFYETGGRAGHVVLYLGNGEIASNDILENGQISVVAASLIESKWGSRYVGWAAP